MTEKASFEKNDLAWKAKNAELKKKNSSLTEKENLTSEETRISLSNQPIKDLTISFETVFLEKMECISLVAPLIWNNSVCMKNFFVKPKILVDEKKMIYSDH